MHWTWEFVVILGVPFVGKEGMRAALWWGSLPKFSIFDCYLLKHRELSWNTKDGNIILFWKVTKNCIVGGLEMVCQELSGKQPYVYTWSPALSKQQNCCPWHLKTKWLNAEVTVLWLTILMRASTYLGPFRTPQQWEGWRVPWGTWDSSTCTKGERRCHFGHFSDSEHQRLMLWLCSEPGPLSPSYLVFPKCFVVTLTVASNDLTSQIGLTAFFLRLDSVEIAPLQHKGRPNLPFSPPWWLHGKEVWLYLRPAVTLAQHGGLSYTGSMSVWQGQLTSFQLASNVLQENVREMLPLSLPAHPLFMLQPWNVACGLCGCEGVSTI